MSHLTLLRQRRKLKINMAILPATFPLDVWDGDTDNPDRIGRRYETEPNNQDWDRLVAEVIAMQAQAYSHENLLRIPHLTTFHWEKNQKTGLNSLAGGVTELAAAQSINSGNTINVTKNPSKLLIVVNSASILGTLTVTGNRISSLTGAVTPNYTEDIVVDETTLDGTVNTANNGTKCWKFTNAYITNELYSGDVVISTSDLVSTDVDVYSCWYFQNPQVAKLELDAVTLTAEPNNLSAALDLIVYMATTNRSAKKVTITPAHVLEVNGVNPVVDAGGLFAIQRVGMSEAGSVIYPANYDGIFVNLAFYPAAQTYWESVLLSVWTSWYHAQTKPGHG